jgi:hypothetical protein
MSEYDNTNRGSIWKNNDRATDRHPHMTGTLNVEGKSYWVSAWTKDKDANPKAPLLTFSIKAKEEQTHVVSVETPSDTFTKPDTDADESPW